MNDRRSISELTIANFKAFAEKQQRMPIKPLTFIYGPNGSGKSSLLQAIILARKAMRNGMGIVDEVNNPSTSGAIDHETFQRFVHRHDSTRNINLGFGIDIQDCKQVSVEFVIGTLPRATSQHTNHSIRTKQFSVRHAGRVILSFGFDQFGTGTLKVYDRCHRLLSSGTIGSYHVEVPLGKLFPDFTPGVSKENQVWLPDSCHQLLGRIRAAFSRDIRSLSHLGALRSLPNFDSSDAYSDKSGDSMCESAWPWNQICKNQQLRNAINEWMGAEGRLKIPYSIVVHQSREPIKGADSSSRTNSLSMDRISLIDTRNNTTVSIKNGGFGMFHLLPILATVLGSRGRLIAIEQPEVSLHPAIHAELADVFLHSAIERHNAVMVETHSEVLLLRILRRIRESTESGGAQPPHLRVRPDQVCVIYVQPTDTGSRVSEIPLTSDGDFEGIWPDGFFREQARELF